MATAYPILAPADEEAHVAPSGRSELSFAVLKAAQAGDRAALEHLVRHYQDWVFAFLSRLVGAGPHVEDLAQEVFVRAYRALPCYEPRRDARLSTWLLTIAVHLVRDRQRKRALPVVPMEAGLSVPSTSSPEHDLQGQRLARRLEQAVSELPDEQRTVLILADFHDQDIESIARLTDCKVSTSMQGATAQVGAGT